MLANYKKLQYIGNSSNSKFINNYYILFIQYMQIVTDIFLANRFEIITLYSLITSRLAGINTS